MLRAHIRIFQALKVNSESPDAREHLVRSRPRTNGVDRSKTHVTSSSSEVTVWFLILFLILTAHFTCASSQIV